MERYNFIKTYKNNNKEYYSIPIYPKIEEHFSDIIIITNSETRLDILAYQYYNDSTLYWIIAIANDIYNIFVEAGKKIKIPNQNRISEIIIKYKDLNKF